MSHGSNLGIDGSSLSCHVCLCLFQKCLLGLFVLPVECSLGVSLGLKNCHDRLVLPASLVSKTADGSVLSVRLDLDLFETRWNDHSLALIIRGWDALECLNKTVTQLPLNLTSFNPYGDESHKYGFLQAKR